MMYFTVIVQNEETGEEQIFDFESDLKRAIKMAQLFVEDEKYNVIIMPRPAKKRKCNNYE